MDAIRGMLDELMGKERDAPLHERAVKQIDFSDPDVCKYELASVCPNQLFKNTRSDLGACWGGCSHLTGWRWQQAALSGLEHCSIDSLATQQRPSSAHNGNHNSAKLHATLQSQSSA
jgi:hypothetical protein